MLSRQEHIDIFANLQQILPTNKLLYKEMLEKMVRYDTPVGGIFVKMADYLKAYTSYCANQEKMYMTIDRLKHFKPEFAAVSS